MVKKNEAPGTLELVRVFVNTLDVETGRDALGSPPALRQWLTEHELLADGDVSEPDRRRAAAVRDALRSLLLANAAEESSPADAIATLNDAARRAALEIRFVPEGAARFEPLATGMDGALGRLLAIVAEAMADGSWSRLKACRSETCQFAFYDRSRNRSGVWCDMAVCGNRTKVRAFRARRDA